MNDLYWNIIKSSHIWQPRHSSKWTENSTRLHVSHQRHNDYGGGGGDNDNDNDDDDDDNNNNNNNKGDGADVCNVGWYEPPDWTVSPGF